MKIRNIIVCNLFCKQKNGWLYDNEKHTVAQNKIAELIDLDRNGKCICLACFCPDETLCHRSIVASILQYAGIAIHGVKDDYSQYGKIWFSIA